jgi:hypothetical protein
VSSPGSQTVRGCGRQAPCRCGQRCGRSQARRAAVNKSVKCGVCGPAGWWLGPGGTSNDAHGGASEGPHGSSDAAPCRKIPYHDRDAGLQIVHYPGPGQATTLPTLLCFASPTLPLGPAQASPAARRNSRPCRATHKASLMSRCCCCSLKYC